MKRLDCDAWNRGLGQSHTELWSWDSTSYFYQIEARGPVLYSSEITVFAYELLPGKRMWPWVGQLLLATSNSLEELRWELLANEPQAAGEWVLQPWSGAWGIIRASTLFYQKWTCFLPFLHNLCMGTWDTGSITRSSSQSQWVTCCVSGSVLSKFLWPRGL